jgi:rfaE bifunctional protein kinase chain/domain
VTAPTLASHVPAFSGRTVLVVGDLMLDRFMVGRVDRISPEAPVPVVRFEREEVRLGGAANVARNLLSLGGRAVVCGVIGEDEAAARLQRELDAAGLGLGGLVTDPTRPTTTKTRIVTERNQQVARIDHESDQDLTTDVERLLLARVAAAASEVDAVVISDYLKGTISPAVAAQAIAHARARRVPVIVDPKVPHVDYYRGASVVTPNHHEAEAVTLLAIRTPRDAAAAARSFRHRTGCDAVLITWGERGMWLLESLDNGELGDHELPAVAREVSDVTGAGDTVVATLALSLAAGAPLRDAATLANHAAGIVVGRFGPATTSPQELIASLG